MTQMQTVDDLERALAQAEAMSAEDTASRIHLLNTLAWELSDLDASRAAELAERAYALAATLADDAAPGRAGMAYSLRTQGYLNMRSGDYPCGMTQLLTAQVIFEALQAEGGPATTDGLIDVFDGIAGIYGQMGNFAECLALSYRMLELAEQGGDLRRIANAQNNLANVYFQAGDYTRTRTTLEENARQAAAIGYRRIEVLSYLNLAELCFHTGDLPTALDHALHGLSLTRDGAFTIFEPYALDFLGKIHLKLGNPTVALDCLAQALEASRRLGSKVTETVNLITLGQAYSEIGQPEQALAYLQQSIALAEQLDAKGDGSRAHLLLSELYERQGDAARALAHFKQYHAQKEAVAGERADQRLKVLQVAHDTATARRAAEALRSQTIELQREIGERVRAEAQLQYQLEIVRALSAFSQALLAPAESEADRRQVLARALGQLIAPTQDIRASLTQNCQDAALGFCSRQIAASAATPEALARDAARTASRQSLAAQPGSTPQPPTQPWSLAPAAIYELLAAGKPVGGPVRELYAATPQLRDYLLNEAQVRSLQFFPITVGERWWGTIALADMANERTLGEDDTLLLSAAAEMLTNTIQRWQAEDQLRLLNDRLEAQVDRRTAELREAVDLLRTQVRERERAEATTQAMVATLERRVAARTAEVATFFDLTLLAGQAVRLGDVFVQVLPRIIEVTRSQAIAIHLLADDRNGLELAGQLNLSSELQPPAQAEPLPPAFQRWMAQPNDPLLTTALHTMESLPPAFRLPGLQTYLGAQVRVGARIEGVLSCYRASDRGYGLDEVALVTALAEQIGMMLATQQLRQNTRTLAVVEERQRLARDMHDSVSQSLYSLALFAQAGREAAEDGDAGRLALSLAELEQTTLQALREMRLLLYELRPADLQQEGLVRALQLRLNAVEQRTGLQLNVQLDELPALEAQCEAELYHIIVEALNNVVKHAAATCVTLQIKLADQLVRVQINDDGYGFDPQQATGGMGLRNIGERVARLNGQLAITSAPGRGTRLEIVIPYTRWSNTDVRPDPGADC